MSAYIDLVCMGRVAVDLYGEEYGATLAEARRFQRYLGGTSGNLAVSAARLGLSVAFAGAVGDDPAGAYLRERLQAENVDISALATLSHRRTALAFLGMDSPEAVALDFYRERAADSEICLTPAISNLIARSRAVAMCGSHFADPDIAERLLPIFRAARSAGACLVLDLDLRRQIWAALAGGLEGAAARVAAAAKGFDIVVGNAEEWSLIAGVSDPSDDLEALQTAASGKTAILKLGAEGVCAVGPGQPWVRVCGRNVEVVNPVGAGDAFLGGFLASHLRGEPIEAALEQGNLCGAIVVTRHGCSTAMPFADELATASELDPASPVVLRKHRLASRPLRPARVMALACDHRLPFAELARANGRTAADISRFKALVVDAALSVGAAHHFAPAVLMDDTYGKRELARLARLGAWVGRPVEVTKSRPLAFEAGEDIAAALRSWHPMQVAKCLVWHHPEDQGVLRATQMHRLHALQAAARGAEIEWMLEAVPPLDMGHDDATLARSVAGLYEAGLEPDYWKLPLLTTEEGWRAVAAVIRENDPACRGVVVLGLDRPLSELLQGLALAGEAGICSGFAIGRSIFGAAARQWFEGKCSDEDAVAQMTGLYAQAVAAFCSGRASSSQTLRMETNA